MYKIVHAFEGEWNKKSTKKIAECMYEHSYMHSEVIYTKKNKRAFRGEKKKEIYIHKPFTAVWMLTFVQLQLKIK
jgi:hypothetical protein